MIKASPIKDADLTVGVVPFVLLVLFVVFVPFVPLLGVTWFSLQTYFKNKHNRNTFDYGDIHYVQTPPTN